MEKSKAKAVRRRKSKLSRVERLHNYKWIAMPGLETPPKETRLHRIGKYQMGKSKAKAVSDQDTPTETNFERHRKSKLCRVERLHRGDRDSAEGYNHVGSRDVPESNKTAP
jgi:hypothetical protein